MSAAGVAAVGFITGWGEGVAALPADAREAASGRRVVAIDVPPRSGDRFRRVTRECLIAVTAVEALLRQAGLAPEQVRGDATALVYATAGAYGTSNRTFVEGAGGGALHFPYTAPSAVPAEVTIEFGLTGPYMTLIGGATAALEALWQAAHLVAAGACARALVLAVETFAECEELYARGRWLLSAPLVEAAACALVLPGTADVALEAARVVEPFEAIARKRAGETLACAPLVALALARTSGADIPSLTGEWRGRRMVLTGACRGERED